MFNWLKRQPNLSDSYSASQNSPEECWSIVKAAMKCQMAKTFDLFFNLDLSDFLTYICFIIILSLIFLHLKFNF